MRRCEHKAQIERLFEVQVRGDVRNKPIRQLQDVLAVVGLHLPRRRIEQSGNKKRYWDGLDAGQLKTMERWVTVRAAPVPREALSVSDDAWEEDSSTIQIRGNPEDVMDPLDRPPRETPQSPSR